MIEEKIKNLIEDTITKNNYKLCKVEYVKENNIMFLRVYIDKKGVMSIDDCVTVSNLINPILDEADPIEESYMLDVCSNGGNIDEQ